MAKAFKDIVSDNVPQAIFNGDNRKCLPKHVSVSFPGSDGEALLHLLDLKEICVSRGAACNSRSTEVSRVLRTIGLPVDVAKGTLRMTFGYGNTVHDAKAIANTLIALLKKIYVWAIVMSPCGRCRCATMFRPAGVLPPPVAA